MRHLIEQCVMRDLARTDLQKRLEQSRQKQQQAEEEMENWRQELVNYNQWVCYVAEALLLSQYHRL